MYIMYEYVHVYRQYYNNYNFPDNIYLKYNSKRNEVEDIVKKT